MSPHNKTQVGTCHQCGSDGILEVIQRGTYFPPITKQQITAQITYCPVCKDLDGTAKRVKPRKDCEEYV